MHEQKPFSHISFERTYSLGASTLTVRFGDITTSQADVLVSSDDYHLSMGGGVSRAILDAGGRSIAVDASKWIPLCRGDVAVTGAGVLSARFVFHVVTIGPRPGDASSWEESDDPVESVRAATRRCIALARELGVESIAFPSLGSGVAGIPTESVAAAMADAMAVELGSGEPLRIELFLAVKSWQDDSDYLGFFERFSAAQSVAHEVPGVAAPEPKEVPERAKVVLESERAIKELDEAERATADPTERDAIVTRRADAAAASTDAIEHLRPVRLFVSYAREDLEWAKVFMNHLAGLRLAGLAVWSDQLIDPGVRWEKEILKFLDTADFAVFLVTSSFLGSTYCVETEWKRAQARWEADELRIIPVLLKASHWEPLFGDIQILPGGALPIVTTNPPPNHPGVDESFLSVVMELSRQIKRWQRSDSATLSDDL